MKKDKRFLFGALAIYLLVAFLFLIFYRPNYLTAILIVLMPPTLAVWWQLKNSRARVLVFSLVSVVLFAPPTELMARLADAWDVASIFPRLWGTAPLENLLFAFLNFWLGLSLYELLAGGDKAGKIAKKMFWLAGLYGLFFLMTISLYKINPAWIAFDYYQLAMLVVVAPLVVFCRLVPGLIKKAATATGLLAAIFFVFEMVALQLRYCCWPGEYLWPINIGGKIFPVDDIVFWYLLSTPALIGGYEFFAKDFIDTKVKLSLK
jgi:hypothetical protein